jgi:hypothetical protein
MALTVKPMATAQEMADKMIRNSANAGTDWLNGTLNPSRSPKAAAAAASGKWKTGVQKAITTDAYSKGVANINEDQMAATIQAVGAAGYTAGIQARQAKIQAAYTRLQPKLLAIKQAISAMPNTTDQDNENRMLTNLRQMRAIKGT